MVCRAEWPPIDAIDGDDWLWALARLGKAGLLGLRPGIRGGRVPFVRHMPPSFLVSSTLLSHSPLFSSRNHSPHFVTRTQNI